MSESKPQPKRSLVKAKAVLQAQWPEVLQYLGDRSVLTSGSNHDLSVAHPVLAGKALAMPKADLSK